MEHVAATFGFEADEAGDVDNDEPHGAWEPGDLLDVDLIDGKLTLSLGFDTVFDCGVCSAPSTKTSD